MDDRWIAFIEDNRLYLHRSWTGLGVYEVQYVRSRGAWGATEALVTGDGESYRRKDDASETALLERLIQSILMRDFSTGTT